MTLEPKDVQLPHLPNGYVATFDQDGRVVAGAPIDAIAVRVIATGQYPSVELIPFDCAFEAMDPGDWSRESDALYAPADLVLALIDAAGRNTTANKLREAMSDAIEALTVTSTKDALATCVKVARALTEALEALR